MMAIRNGALALLLALLSQMVPSAHAGLAVASSAAHIDDDMLLREAFLDEMEADEGLQALSQEVSQRFQRKDMYILVGDNGQPEGK
mmetsp:Transcript_6443/g.13228  ORF Transcript_6443/g.13228 Transcript_6443/m.13228 type:complete len:86 (+) Transcript_6443:100-357(+)